MHLNYCSPLTCEFEKQVIQILCFCLTARDSRFDVVLVDTAGRMQDNEPLMRSLAKVIITIK